MQAETEIPGRPLLIGSDPAPFEIVNAKSDHPVVLVCEHAGQAIPAQLDDLGISKVQLDRHIGWDIGASAVTKYMADFLGAPAVLQRYSRLVIDCNRPTNAADAMPIVSDAVPIPGNACLDVEARAARVSEIFDPFQEAVASCFALSPRRATFSIHSFTPALGGIERPWDIGFLYRKDTRTSEYLASCIAGAHPELKIGMNQPYQIDDASDWFVPNHGEARGLPHSLIEIRNDHIAFATGQMHWASLLSDVIHRLLKEL